MTIRTWLYSQLTNDYDLSQLIGESNPRVFAKKSMTSSKEDCPFLVYKLGYQTRIDLAEEMPENLDPGTQYIQVWIHDYTDTETASYVRIDEVQRLVKKVLHNKSSKDDGVILCKYLETSQDLNDETLGTVNRYMRFQITYKETS